MKKHLVGVFLWMAVLSRSCAAFAAVASDPGSTQVYFSPEGGCTQAIVKELDGAKVAVLVMAYSFTSKPIARALVDAHKRGVIVEMVADPEIQKEERSQLGSLLRGGVSIFIDAAHNLAHNKVMLIDGETLITGSFNFTTAAEKYNAENLLVMHDKALVIQYLANWHSHRKHSQLLPQQ